VILNRRPYAPSFNGHSGQHIDCPLCRAHQRSAFVYASRGVDDAIEVTPSGYRWVFFVDGKKLIGPQELVEHL